ncbi:MAG: winged helix DNA-binding domain-containing protein [Actinomycetota bacterium]
MRSRREISAQERRARLGQRHFLARRAKSLVEAAGAMVGIHASDPATVFLALRARTEGTTIDRVESAFYDDRDLIRMIGMRRTMFAVPLELGSVLQAACANSIIPAERRRTLKLVAGTGFPYDDEAWLDRIMAATLTAVKAGGPRLAGELSADVPELAAQIPFGEGKRWAGSMGVSTRVLFLLSLGGLIGRGRPRGGWTSSQHRWEPIDAWRPGGLGTIPAGEARPNLIRRWLAAFGPGSLTDLRWWTGWPLGEVNKALESIEAVEVSMEGEPGWMLASDLEHEADPRPWVALLPGLDPTPMGWKSRGFYLGPHQAALFDRNGNIGPTVWADGRVVGGWAQTSERRVAFRLLQRVGKATRLAIEEEAAAVEDWIECSKVTPRFRTPLEIELGA